MLADYAMQNQSLQLMACFQDQLYTLEKEINFL